MPNLTFSINIETISQKIQKYHLIASPQELREIADRLNLIDLNKLEAKVSIFGKERIFLTGLITADVTQECVRTLHPLPQHMEIQMNEVFSPAPLEEEKEIILEDTGAIEPLEGSILDIGEVVIQLLSLNLDPFPVTPSTSPIEYKEDLGKTSPFDILKK